MTVTDFLEAVAQIAEELRDAHLDGELEARLNERFPLGGEQFIRLSALCAKGEAEGGLMSREAGGTKFRRVVKPGTQRSRVVQC